MTRRLSAGILGMLVTLLAGCAGSSQIGARVAAVQIDSNSYIVQAGDTIESVAFRYRLTSNQLAALNPGMSNSVYPGQRLAVRSGRRQINPDANRLANNARRAQAEVQANYRPAPQSMNPAYQQQEELPVYQPGKIAPPVVVSKVPQRGQAIIVTNPDNTQVREEVIEESVATGNLAQRAGAPLPILPPTSGWLWPINGEVVRDYAPNEPNGQGIDIAGVPGQQIKAVADGTVIYAGRDLSDSGNLVIVRHSEDVLSTYSHAKDLFVVEKDAVRRGDPVANLGSNSNRESVLHFGVRKSGKPVDPIGYLPNR